MSVEPNAPEVSPDDLLAAAAACQQALAPALQDDWEVRAGDLDWTCRRTLDHMADALLFYTSHLATRSPKRLPRLRNGAPDQPLADLLTAVGVAASVLAEVARAAPPSTRAFHPAGLADVSGFAAVGCTELFVHTGDIAQGLGRPFRPPAALDEWASGLV